MGARFFKSKRVVAIAAIALCAVVLTLTLSVLTVSIYVKQSVKSLMLEDASKLCDKGHFDCVIVLGAGLKPDGTPSSMLEDRIKVGVEVFNAVDADFILMSGDRSGDGYDEPNAMRTLAEQLGVDADRILTDECGFSTYESIYRANDIYGFDRIVAVTQEYHLYRTLYIADRLGFDAYGVSADLRSYRGQLVREIREIFARVKDFLICI